MPDQIAVPEWLMEMWSQIVAVLPDVTLGDLTIPGWMVLLVAIPVVLGFVAGTAQQRQRRREHEELVQAIRDTKQG